MKNHRSFLNWRLLAEIILRVIFVLLFKFMHNMPAYKRVILQNETDQHKYPLVKEFIPFNAEWIIIIGIPVIIILIDYIYTRNIHDVMDSMLGLSLSIGLTVTVTQILKIIVGRPRPNFFALCRPDENMMCTTKREMALSSRKSFPSGHTSVGFASMVFLTMYVANKLNVFNDKGRGNGWKVTLCLMPILVAFLIAATRIWSNQHFWDDVIFGVILGTVSTVFCYHQYLPSLDGSKNCQLTHCSTEMTPDDQLKVKIRLNVRDGKKNALEAY